MSCGWPFHNDPKCEECQAWEVKYGENLDHWLKVRTEVLAAARAERAASRKTTQPTENA